MVYKDHVGMVLGDTSTWCSTSISSLIASYNVELVDVSNVAR